ncbi:cyclophilin-like fold protein [Frigoribacterium sp. R86507]|uniref:cyclophilin-like fold protein n=1 Tax=Frigoribacterium sp. R86507 TaxID=3093850 RepID=UPI0037C8E751
MALRIAPRRPSGRPTASRRASTLLFLGVGVGVTALAACSTSAGNPADTADPSISSSSPASDGSPTSRPESTPSETPVARDDAIVGTVVRFSGGGRTVDVTLEEDNPTTRDLLSRLPTTIRFEEFAGREKIGYPSPGLTVEGSPGSDPEDGDLIYFSPWGNLGFYYDATGIEYSDDTIHLGSYDATRDELADFDDTDVTLEVLP